MARPLSFISDINDKKDFWKLVVRVKDKWSVRVNGKEHFEMILNDEKVDFSVLYFEFNVHVFYVVLYIFFLTIMLS